MPLFHLIVAIALIVPHVQAQIAWDAGVGNFDTPGNWVGDQVPDGNDAILINNGGTAQATGMFEILSVSIGGSSTLEVMPGIGSQFEVSDEFYVGTSGTGTLSIGSEALVATGDFYAGFVPGSTGLVNMTGGYLSPFTTYIGYQGNATFNLQSGSTLQSTVGYVGYLPGSQGTIQLNNSTWKAEDQGLPVNITVGAQGTGEIDAENSQISSLQMIIGDSTGSQGTVTLSGGTLTTEENLQVGNSGTGTLTLTNGAEVSSDGIAIGTLGDSTGTASVTDSTLASSANIFVGLTGNGTLQTDGALINAHELFIARNAASTGLAEISGGTMTITAELHVGAEGHGTFTLEGGGILNTNKGNMGFARGATGIANINDGQWNNTQAIFVGVSGTGTLNTSTGAVINSESGYISQNADGTGTVNMTGGSWTMSDTLVVGVNGAGEFTITNGGEVSSAWSQLGLNAGSSGVVNVNNASWTTTETLTIGALGDGEFYATNNATVTAQAIEVAGSAGVSGLLSVTNSTINTENILGATGAPSLEFSGATLNLLGGSEVLDTLLISGFASGDAVVNSGGLTIDTQGGNAQIGSVLSGTGSLTKTGAGRLRMDTTADITGGVLVQGGVLEITNNASLGTGGTSVGTAELRAISDINLSNAEAGSPPSLTILGNQIATFSATAGNTFTLATQDFVLQNGGGLVAGSAGNTGSVVFNPETLTVPSAVSQVTVQAGSLLAGGAGLEQLTAVAQATTIASGATLDFQDNLSGSGINVLLGAGIVNTGVLTSTSLVVNSGNFSGNISGSGALVKETTGTLILSGQNAFTGGTTINAGTLIVDGDLSFGLGKATINNGATLGGNGILGTIFLTGGTLAPGSSAGTLTAQNLEWESGIFEFDLGANQAASDLLSIGGLFGFGTDYTFSFVDQGWTVGYTYNLINSLSSDISVNDFRFSNGGGFDGVFTYNGQNLQFRLTAIPEPSSWSMLAVVAALFAISRMTRLRGVARED